MLLAPSMTETVVAAVVRHVDAVRVGVDGHALGATPNRYCGDDSVAGAVDDGDVVAAMSSPRRCGWCWGSRATPAGATPHRYGGDDRVAGAVDDGDVAAARVRHVDAVRVGVDATPSRAVPRATVATTVLLAPSMTETLLLPSFAT